MRRLRNKIVCGLFALGGAIANALLAGGANAQVFNKIVDNATPNTIAGGLFSPDVTNSRPTVDGNNVIFRNLNSAKPELYSFNGSSFQRLVTTNSLLPGCPRTGCRRSGRRLRWPKTSLICSLPPVTRV